jgi:hypothetical protein
MNWKGFGRKQSWLNHDIPVLALGNKDNHDSRYHGGASIR